MMTCVPFSRRVAVLLALTVFLFCMSLQRYSTRIYDSCIPSSRCYVTQRGSDGFGHQLDGKLSIIALGEGLKDEVNVKYVHTNFYAFEHTKEEPAVFDEFLNFSHLFFNFNELQKRYGGLVNLVRKPMLTLVEELKAGKLQCCDNVVYWDDNAWHLMENNSKKRAVYVDLVRHSDLFRNLRASYHASPKPAIYLDPSRMNVAIHIRRGDAHTTRQVLGIKYFELAIDYVLNYSKKLGVSASPLFLVETDEPEWIGLQKLREKYGNKNFVIGQKGSGGIRSAFHTMVMADVLIVSSSSLSKAAQVLRRPSQLTIACYSTENGDWYYYHSASVVYVCDQNSFNEMKEPSIVSKSNP